MKRYISSAVSIENLRTQFAPDMEDTKFKDLIDLDPSADFEKNKGGKYCPWIFRQEKKGNLPEEQYTNLKDALSFFLNNYKKYPKSDIGQYKTVDEFLTDTEAVGNRELTDKEKARLAKKQAHRAGDEDKKFIASDGTWEVWQPLTKAGSVSLARHGGEKAKWCTAYEGDDYYWKQYTKQGPLYIFINTANPKEKYQLHFESNSWYDISDRSQGMRAFYEFCEQHPAFQEAFEIKTKDGVMTRSTSIVGYVEDATEFIIPDGVTSLPEIKFPSGAKKIILPDSITTLKSYVFANLADLTEIKLSAGLKAIPSYAFKNCTSIEHIDIPDSVKLYNGYAFSECNSLKSIKHSANLVVVMKYCFQNCVSLDTQLPDTVKDIGPGIFEGVGMPSIRIPSEVTTLDPMSFINDKKLNAIDLNNVDVVSAKAFKNSGVKEVDLSKVVYIGADAFRGCDQLASIKLNSEGGQIGPYAFAGCSSIRGPITISEGLSLGLSAFDDCLELAVDWKAPDQDYEFENIKLLKCSEKQCPELVKANKGYIKIETTEGNTYEVQ